MIPQRYLDFYGDETRWFIGKVVSNEDPAELGRVRVRINGVHSDNKIDIPDEDLPWAQVVIPVTEGGTSGFGNNVGIQVDARVFGIFLDGTNSQLPMVLGSLPRLDGTAEGGRTTSQQARGTNTIPPNPDNKIDEPADPYQAKYPYNAVHATRSGHIIEVDDTPDHERIKIYHTSGTFVEFHPNGDVVTQLKNGFRSVIGDDKIHVTGDMVFKVDGTLDIDAKAVNINAETTSQEFGSGEITVAGITQTKHTHTDTPGLGAGTTSTPKG